MSKATDDLEERLRKAGIAPDVFVDLLWARIRERVEYMIATKNMDAQRQAILAAVAGGQAVRWDQQGGQATAQSIQRLVDRIMESECRRLDERKSQ